jgi:hypothetical protein
VTITEQRPYVGELWNDTARVRRTDPITSHEAADTNNTARSIGMVLDILQSEPLADHEIETLAAARGSQFTGQRLRTARAALVEQGRVEATGIYRLTMYGRRANVWQVIK